MSGRRSRCGAAAVPPAYCPWPWPGPGPLIGASRPASVSFSETTNRIVLNARDLSVQHADLRLAEENRIIMAESISLHEEQQRCTIVLPQAVPAQSQGQLRLEFSGTLNDAMAGFYRAQYTRDGHKRYMAVTQFESADARRAFPCWDEPAVKAQFDVTLRVPADRVALSNMPQKSETVRDRTRAGPE